MRAILLKDDLTKGLGIVSRVVARRGQLPVLANVLIFAAKSGLRLAATNLEIGLQVEVGGKVEEEGAITVPGRNFAEFVGSLGEGNIKLETEGEKLKIGMIGGEKSAATFAGIAASEFPSFAPSTGSTSHTTSPLRATGGQAPIKIKKELLLETASQVAYAAAVDESRPVLTGVRIQKSGDSLVFVATDGFRLSRKLIQGSRFSVQDSIILPARTILELARVVESEEIIMEAVKENNQVIFSCGDVQLVSRVLEGNYPDVDKIIPKDFKTELVIDREDLGRAIRTAGIFARENSNIIRFKIAGSRINIYASGGQMGESENEIEMEKGGEDVEIAFNYKFVLDFLGSISEERVKLRVNDGLSPGVFAGEKDKSLIHLIMPVRT